MILGTAVNGAIMMREYFEEDLPSAIGISNISRYTPVQSIKVSFVPPKCENIFGTLSSFTIAILYFSLIAPHLIIALPTLL